MLAVAVIWIGLTTIMAMLALSIDVHDKMNLELRSFGSNIKLVPVAESISVSIGGHDVSPSADLSSLEEADMAKLKTIFWRNNVLGISPRLWVRGQVGNNGVSLLGVWIDHEIVVDGGEPFITGARQVHRWQVEGSWPAPAGEAQCMIGRDLARKLDLAIGDSVAVKAGGSAEFMVAGILATGQREDGAIIAQLRNIQDLAGLQGKVSHAEVSALTTPEDKLARKYQKDPKLLTAAEYERWFCTPFPGSVAVQIQEAVPGSVARVVRRISESQGATLNRIEGLMCMLAIATMVSCCLSVAGVLASAVLERRQEVALMQALGAHRGEVLLLFLCESAVLGIVGGALAAATGTLLGRWLVSAIFGGEASAHVALLVLSPFLGLVVGWLGSVWPVWHTLKQDTARLLHGS